MSSTVAQRPGRLDLELVEGDDAVLELSFVDELGAPVNMAGRAWQLRLSGPGFAVELDGLVVTTFASSGVLSLPFPDTTTSAIPSGTTWYLRDNTNDRTLLDGEFRAYVAGYAGAGAGTTTQTVTITNDTAAVTVTASVGTGGGADLSDSTPQALGTAAAGTGTAAARDDHVHAMPTAADVGADADGAAQAVADSLGGAAVLDVGTTTGTVAAGDDSRLSDARTPTSHNHAASEVTSGTLDIARIPTGTTSTTVRLGNDAAYTDSRTPNVAGSNDDFMQRKAGAWSARTVAQVRSDLGAGIPRGGYYYLNGQSGGNFTPTKNRMYLTPWQPGGPITLTKIAAGVVVVGNSGSVIRLGLYACNSAGQPSGSPLVDGGTIVADSGAGVKEVTISTAVTDQMICMAFVWQVGTVGSGACNGVSAVGATLGHLIGSSTAILGTSAFPASCWYQDGVTGALPTISLSGTLGDFAPRMLVKGS